MAKGQGQVLAPGIVPMGGATGAVWGYNGPLRDPVEYKGLQRQALRLST